jgi:hypothetical protein
MHPLIAILLVAGTTGLVAYRAGRRARPDNRTTDTTDTPPKTGA